MPATADLVKETSTTTGTGSITTSGTAATGFQTFATGLGSGGCVTTICIRHQSANEWETCWATFNGTTGLTRDEVIESSNAGALVNFSAGTKDVYVVLPAKFEERREGEITALRYVTC